MNAFNVFILFIFYWTSLAGPIRRTPKNAFGKRHQLNNDDTKWSDEEPVASNHRKFYISNYHKRPLRSVRHSDDYEDKNITLHYHYPGHDRCGKVPSSDDGIPHQPHNNCQHIHIHLNGTMYNTRTVWRWSMLTIIVVIAVILLLLNCLHYYYGLGVYHVKNNESTENVSDEEELESKLLSECCIDLSN